LIIKVWPRKW